MTAAYTGDSTFNASTSSPASLNLYGTTYSGGSENGGIVLELVLGLAPITTTTASALNP
jgi:hypothetical protein